MELTQAAAEYMAGIAPRFQQAGHALTANVRHEGGVFAGVARREKGEVTRVGVTRNLFLLTAFPSIDRASMRAYADACFRHATKVDYGVMPEAWADR